MTLEGTPANTPVHFVVPALDPGDYRIRLDATHRDQEIGDIQACTATLYAFLRVLSAE